MAEKNLPATKGNTNVAMAPEMADSLLAMQGGGMEQVRQEDLLMPRLGIIQALSPQLNPRKPEYIEGAKVGMIFNTATGALFDGDKGVHLVPVLYQRRYIEWARNRGGLIKDHGTDDTILGKCKDEPKQDRPKVMLQITPDDNVLTVTATWYVLNLSESGAQAFVPMSSSQWKASRKWMTMATSERVQHPVHGAFQPPLFYRTYVLRTQLMTKGDDEWYVWSIGQDVTLPEYMAANPGATTLLQDAKFLFDAVKSGDIIAAADEAFGGAGEGEGSDVGGKETF